MTSESIYQTCGHCGKRTSRETEHCWHCQTLVEQEPRRRRRGWHIGAGAALLVTIALVYPSKNRGTSETATVQIASPQASAR